LVSDLDDRFLRDSQAFDRREVDRAKQLLEKAQQKARLIIRGGFVGLFMICVVAAGITWRATETTKLAEQKRQQAQQERQQAEQKRQQAEQKSQQAQQERQQAEQKSQQAQQERQQAEQKRQQAEQVAEARGYTIEIRKYFDAVLYFEQAIRVNPNNNFNYFRTAESYITIGDYYYQNSDFKNAKLNYEQAQSYLNQGILLGVATINIDWVNKMQQHVSYQLNNLQRGSTIN
jgi:tetratricopeptide (TPR) repeat protein